MEKNHFFNTDETLELACVVKTICDKYNVPSEELVALPTADDLLALNNKTKFKKRLSVRVPIPQQLAPKSQKEEYWYFNACIERDIDAEDYNSLPLDRLGMGLGEFELQGERKIQFWSWHGSGDYYLLGYRSLHFIRRRDLFSFIKTLKRWKKENASEVEPPILPAEMLVEIYNNTVGFLLKGKEKEEDYKKYKIPYKRGVLLCGNPGSGKTLTCKWLRELCSTNNLGYRIISMEAYREALNRSKVRSLFKLPRQQSGIIFFDDMDIMVKNRKDTVNAHELSTFLSELDGIEPAEGVVFVFTTNYIAELDEAFVRPGRIDLWLPFLHPTEKMRQRFIEQKFGSEILNVVDVNDLIERTSSQPDGKEYSFAEMEEIRKLFCMDLIDDKKLDVERTFKMFDKHRKEFAKRAEIKGFGSLQDDEEESDYADFDDLLDNPPWRS